MKEKRLNEIRELIKELEETVFTDSRSELSKAKVALTDLLAYVELLEGALKEATTEVSIDDFEEGKFWLADKAKFSTKDERPRLWAWLMEQPVWINTKAAEETAKERETRGEE